MASEKYTNNFLESELTLLLAASKTIVDLCFLDFLTRYCSKFKQMAFFLLTMSTFRVNLSSLNLALLHEESPKLMD